MSETVIKPVPQAHQPPLVRKHSEPEVSAPPTPTVHYGMVTSREIVDTCGCEEEGECSCGEWELTLTIKLGDGSYVYAGVDNSNYVASDLYDDLCKLLGYS